MKKIKVIVAAILRGALIMAPGAAFLWWAWGKVPALFSILAAGGLESLYLLLFSIVILGVRGAREIRDKKEEESA